MTSPILELHSLGQSLWMDNIRRKSLQSGEFKALVDAGEIRGVTSNPTIFEKSISGGQEYDEAIRRCMQAGLSPAEIFDSLAAEDIQSAADILREVYDRTDAGDGYVSIEVNPLLANDTPSTIAEVKRLWQLVDRPNLMVKIPATHEGLPAIEQSIADGFNINITLIFALERHAEVMEAYLKGLERRAAAGLPIDRIASVASFFVSRVDTLVDSLLEAIVRAEDPRAGEAMRLMGKAAVANARLAYARFRNTFSSERWEALKARGARLQRPLWASTSTKNPRYSDVMYVEELIGPDTVNTLPPATLDAYRDHGDPAPRLIEGLDEAGAHLAVLEKLGVSMEEVTQQLEKDGVAAFSKSFETLLNVIEKKGEELMEGKV